MADPDLGVTLGRMSRDAATMLAGGTTGLRLVEGWQPDRGDSLSLRGLATLPVTWRLTDS